MTDKFLFRPIFRFTWFVEMAKEGAPNIVCPHEEELERMSNGWHTYARIDQNWWTRQPGQEWFGPFFSYALAEFHWTASGIDPYSGDRLVP